MRVLKVEEISNVKEQLKLVHVYKVDENRIIQIITNNLEWLPITIGNLYKKRRDVEYLFQSDIIKFTSMNIFMNKSKCI